jgi:tetratricopeptide (TPR) repeat protein
MVIVLLILLFVITGFTVRRYHAVERGLAQDWYNQGEQALKAGHAAAALADFRNAVAYSRDNPLYQLRLAQALAATGRLQEARTYLLSLRDREPGNGPVNLELARLAVREHAIPEAVQYFHDAVYSEWEGDPVVQRRAVRLELVKFLLGSDQKAAARAELIAIAANLPPDAELHTEVGVLLMNAGGYDDALRLFRQALAAKPRSAPALAGAGECYFLSGQYAQAEPYLDQALRRDPNLTQVGAMRDTARAVLNLDPFIRWLGEREREQRARQAFDQAMTRLQACAAQRGIDLRAASGDPLPTLYAQATAFQPRMRQRTLPRDSEWVSNTMDLVFDIEKAASQACGEPQGLDLALVLIAREQEGARP